ncbi:hypothetical protein FF100_20515 [Methylobacterium terricola]|uniref:Uncharacterized protein n=1 Tax=Methylobacterium terricola TaxID=2583531 RepID=A0A5C4LCJ5_9HYPH|nr:hypothetical protein [Methylobacterium terricola]TNC10990.1 hypothetical protein FF100_20515 [Methylobacterium terricola]
MSPDGRETAPPSLLRHTWRIALIAIAASLSATHYLASRNKPAERGAVASLSGAAEPETTGSIAGGAARIRLDPCAVTLRP